MSSRKIQKLVNEKNDLENKVRHAKSLLDECVNIIKNNNAEIEELKEEIAKISSDCLILEESNKKQKRDNFLMKKRIKTMENKKNDIPCTNSQNNDKKITFGEFVTSYTIKTK